MVNSYVYADFIARLNNAKSQKFEYIKVNNSNKILETVKILYALGLIKGFTLLDYKTILIYMKYYRKRGVYKKLKLVSTPGKRVYVDLIKMAKLKDKSNCSFFIISTNQGLKTDFECYVQKLCGEILLKIEL
jgi:ribosomal protein S8